MITDEYRELLVEQHKKDDSWGTTGYKHGPWVADFIERHSLDSVLDFGCGKGHLGDYVKEGRDYLDWKEYDPGIPEKDHLPNQPFDIVIATDVLEHVEPEALGSVLFVLGMFESKFIMLHIHTGPARALLPDGRNAHLIQESASWWQEQLAKYIPHFDMYWTRESETDTRFDIILSSKA